jgi:hypothetical protein
VFTLYLHTVVKNFNGVPSLLSINILALHHEVIYMHISRALEFSLRPYMKQILIHFLVLLRA